MEARAISRYVRVSPIKARLVIDAIRGKDVSEALRLVTLSKRKAATPIRKTLESAIANAENNFDVDVDRLYVAVATVDMGRAFRRLKPRAMGRADIFRRPSSHITIVVAERD
ncbi:MAG: 50S ribosomal protein L22 [Candidatus Bipolaricaulota bacterium]|nr:MAG: 50S ribosomal protein L22 [Candidatus Bipolaricaulota bacterium]